MTLRADLFARWCTAATLILGTSTLIVSGCDADDDDHGDGECHEGEEEDHGHGACGGEETEVITTVTLTFTPDGGGDAVTAVFDDPDGSGIMSPTVDDIALTVGETYTVDITFANALEDPPEDITEEIEAEAEEHQVFLYGDAGALLTIAYADVESDYGANAEGEDLPVGLLHTVTVDTAGTAELQVMLRHLPELNGSAQKVPGLADDLAAGETLPGDVDVDITFSLIAE